MPPPPPPPPPPPAAATSSNRTLFIVLGVLGGSFLLIGGCVGACTFYAARKAKAYAASANKNPQFAAVSLAASLHPDIQIVSQDEDAGLIALRNKKTGEVVKLDLKAYSSDNIGHTIEQFARGAKPVATEVSRESAPAVSAAAVSTAEPPRPTTDETTDDFDQEKISPARAAALAAVLKKFPGYVEKYPRAETVEAQLHSLGGFTTGTYTFLTSDKPDAIADFYEKKITAAGFSIISKSSDTNDHGPTAALIAQSGEGGTFSVTAESEPKNVRTTVNFARR